MASASAQRTSAVTIVATDGRASGLVGRGIRNGLIAGVAMAMVMMVLGAFDRGIFAAPSAIWAFWAGPSAYTPQAFTLGVIAGAMGHMMNAAVLGIVFAFLAARVVRPHGAAASVLLGTTFALAVMAIMWLAVLPQVPNGAIVMDSAATWIWVAGHAAFGMAGGLLFARWR